MLRASGAVSSVLVTAGAGVGAGSTAAACCCWRWSAAAVILPLFGIVMKCGILKLLRYILSTFGDRGEKE